MEGKKIHYPIRKRFQSQKQNPNIADINQSTRLTRMIIKYTALNELMVKSRRYGSCITETE